MDINERKKQLIQRAPLGKEFNRQLKAFLENRTLESFHKLNRLIWEIEGKWAVNIRVSEKKGASESPIEDCWHVWSEVPIMVEDARKDIYCTLRGGELIKHGFHKDNLIHCPSSKIPIIIDVQVITLNDAHTVKKTVWDIVEKELRKIAKHRNELAKYYQDIAEQENGDWPAIPEEQKEDRLITADKQKNTISVSKIGPGEIAKNYKNRPIPVHEPEKLRKIIYCRKETFIKYLRWFDLKMEGLKFNLIARQEKIRGGESTVRKGFNEIYFAIYREDGPTEEEKIETLGRYECPTHGSDCPRGCQYRKDWMEIFDRTFEDRYLREMLGTRCDFQESAGYEEEHDSSDQDCFTTFDLP
jgi:hypothetical protein